MLCSVLISALQKEHIAELEMFQKRATKMNSPMWKIGEVGVGKKEDMTEMHGIMHGVQIVDRGIFWPPSFIMLEPGVSQ